jgi:hypothetical protein
LLKKSVKYYFFIISITGLAIYTFFIIYFKKYDFISTQWFKTTIWLKVLSTFAFVLVLEKIKFINFSLNTRFIFPLMALFSIGIMYHPISFFKNKDYHFPFANYQKAEIDIALLAKKNTPIDAQFVTPTNCTAFKYYSERGSYIDFKAVTHSKDAFGTWYERIQEVYRVGGKNASVKGLAVANIADENFANLKEIDFMELKKKGVTHLLCEKKQQLYFTKVVENEQFIIYKIN